MLTVLREVWYAQIMQGVAREQGADGRIDPEVLDWKTLSLPLAWPDRLNLWRPRDVVSYIRRQFGKRQRVELPDGLIGAARLPRYVLQEFHHLPNGNYSFRLANAYVDWFDSFMLGTMDRARGRIADALRGSDSVLDLGCGGGHLAGVLERQGAKDVWGLDPSPYLLREAALRVPRVSFVQGLAEDLEFPDDRFEGVGACFLFHELIPRAAEAALLEIWRVLEPGGLLAITEPAPDQKLDRSLVSFWREGGWRAVYFVLMARYMHEPLVDRWHARDVATSLSGAGFEVLSDETHFPFRTFVARKVDARRSA